MALALFDLDNTLLNGDSDHAWGVYLVQTGRVDNSHQQKQDEYYQQYLNSELDINEFLEFQLRVLTQHSLKQLQKWRAEFIEEIIVPLIDTDKVAFLEKHRDQGDELVIITATNDFVTKPIADLLGVDILIATQAELIDGAYTGKVVGEPCFREGKVTRLRQWMTENKQDLEASWFYSDSINDLPLLKRVENPVAVKPDDNLRKYAIKHHWNIID